ncbi:MAG: hypothetical protein M0010_09390 [Actinomycetota bacterium]|jgi:hypothetical protein|nr:hypothetical protein [Actinomycetota bacterium]
MINHVHFQGTFSINGYEQRVPLAFTADVPLFDEYLSVVQARHDLEIMGRDRRIAELESEVSRLRRRWWRRGGKS